MEEVVSNDLQEKPKAFWSYVKSKRQESTGVAPPKNKDGFIHSDSSSKVEILNDQFVSAYTREDNIKMPTEDPSPQTSLRSQDSQSDRPGFFSCIYPEDSCWSAGTSLDQTVPIFSWYWWSTPDWKNAFIVPVFKKGEKQNHRTTAQSHLRQ